MPSKSSSHLLSLPSLQPSVFLSISLRRFSLLHRWLKLTSSLPKVAWILTPQCFQESHSHSMTLKTNSPPMFWTSYLCISSQNRCQLKTTFTVFYTRHCKHLLLFQLIAMSTSFHWHRITQNSIHPIWHGVLRDSVLCSGCVHGRVDMQSAQMNYV